MASHLSDVSETAASAKLPMPRSQPAYLATMARLRGLESADIEHARVLELGSLAGRNLIPLAERHPQSTFVGIDERQAAVDAARAAAEAVGLTNIEFRCHDLLQLGPVAATFDYIIVPGVYSSLDVNGRDRLLSICRDHLSPHGVAMIAYHTYPAWHIHEMLGRMARYDAREASSPGEQMAKARQLLDVLLATLTDENPYSALLRTEVAPLARYDDVTLRHAYLEGGVRAVYFRQFLADAARNGLQYLGDGVIGAGYTDFIDERTELALYGIAADRLQREQYRDVLRNRRFRETLVCHAPATLMTDLAPAQLEGLFLAAHLRAEDSDHSLRSSNVQRFVGPLGLNVSSAAPMAKAALMHLSEIWPASITLEDLVITACERLEAAGVTSMRESERERLRQNLVDGAVRGAIEVYARPAPFTAQVSARPAASPWARWQAAHGEPPTNRRHEAVWIDPIDAHVLALLDGTRDQAQLLGALVEAARTGQLDIVEQDQRVHGLEHVQPLLAAALADSLPRLARNALLVS